MNVKEAYEKITKQEDVNEESLSNKLGISKTYLMDIVKRDYRPKDEGSKGKKAIKQMKQQAKVMDEDKDKLVTYTGEDVGGYKVVQSDDIKYIADDITGKVKDEPEKQDVVHKTIYYKNGKKHVRYKATEKTPNYQSGRFIPSEYGKKLKEYEDMRRGIRGWKNVRTEDITDTQAIKELKDVIQKERELQQKVDYGEISPDIKTKRLKEYKTSAYEVIGYNPNRYF